MKMKLLRNMPDGESIVRVETGWWFWHRVVFYVGRSTVWHDDATGKRAGTSMENKLCNFSWKRRHDNKAREALAARRGAAA